MYELYLIFALPLVASYFQQCQATPTQKESLARRDLLSDLVNGLDGSVKDAVDQSILQNWWKDIPKTEQDVKDAFKVKNLDTSKAQTGFLNIPGYANYTTTGWNARIRGQMYTLPYLDLPQNTKDDLARAFLPGYDWNKLSVAEKDNARNLTAHIFSVPKSGQDVNFHFKLAPQSPIGGQNGGQTWEQVIKFPYKTNSAGEVAGFLPLQDQNQLPAGDGRGGVVGILDTWVKGIESGNGTTYLVPKEGITIVSDIDDILRETKIYKPQEGLYNSFARDFIPWLNMPSVYASWATQQATQNSSTGAQSPSPYHFHYLTTTPEQATRTYMDFIYNTYPLGSFDTRPLNFTTVEQTFSTRRTLLYQIFQTFPKRKFVLVGDTSNSDVLSEYPKLVQTFPGQVHCILIRNISRTDPEFKMPYNTAEFESLKSGQYMFFNTPDDLKGLNFDKGDCVNQTVQQITDFGWKNLPDVGLDNFDQNNEASSSLSEFSVPAMVLAIVAGIMSAL